MPHADDPCQHAVVLPRPDRCAGRGTGPSSGRRQTPRNSLRPHPSADNERRGDYIDQLMSVRTNISTIVLRMAAKHNSKSVIEFLDDIPSSDASSAVFTEFDYRFYHHVAVSSNNMIYVLILNGLQDLYRKVGTFYFSNSEAKLIALSFYADIKAVFEKGDAQQIMQIVRDSAFASGKIWLRLRDQLPENFLD